MQFFFTASLWSKWSSNIKQNVDFYFHRLLIEQQVVFVEKNTNATWLRTDPFTGDGTDSTVSQGARHHCHAFRCKYMTMRWAYVWWSGEKQADQVRICNHQVRNSLTRWEYVMIRWETDWPGENKWWSGVKQADQVRTSDDQVWSRLTKWEQVMIRCETGWPGENKWWSGEKQADQVRTSDHQVRTRLNRWDYVSIRWETGWQGENKWW